MMNEMLGFHLVHLMRVIVSFASMLVGVESGCVFCFVNRVTVQSEAIRMNELEIMACFL